jgi:hypothetical protein
MPRKTWQQLAELAAGEKDPDKLRALIRELTEALDEQTKGITRQPPQQLSKRLLFVDDEEGIRATLPVLLRQRGFEVNSQSPDNRLTEWQHIRDERFASLV